MAPQQITKQLDTLLDSVLKRSEHTDDLDSFLSTTKLSELLRIWLSISPLPENIKTKTQFFRFLSAEIARIDDLLNQQLNTILHHAEIQRLEASWRGLSALVNESKTNNTVIIRLLNITWNEIYKDVGRLECDQSLLFEKIYSDEFGTAGGKPFSVLLGDYYLNLRGGKSRKDIDTISSIAEIAAASFCPFIAGVTPESFGVDDFSELAFSDHLLKAFDQPDYNRWNNFRNNANSRFTGLTLPRVLLRKPYHNKIILNCNFCFNENTSEQQNYLWGNGSIAFGLAILRSYNTTAWFGHMRGIPSPLNPLSNGVIDQLPVAMHETGLSSSNIKFATEFFIDETDESTFSDLGFIPLCTHKKTGHALLYSNMSAFKVKKRFNQLEADLKISATLQYIFCASRFAHYIKVISRDKVGSLASKNEIEKILTKWLDKYIAKNEISNKLRAKYPLQDAKVEVKDVPGKPGVFNCVIHLQPRYQLEKVSTALTLVTELAEISSH